jgi:RNA polymerase sigma-70 factor (ECF subfamily)
MIDKASPHTPERALETAETARETLSLLDHLRADERTVVVMHYYLEMTLSEIAQATGWRDGTVRSRLSRALGRLRERVEQGVEFPVATDDEAGQWSTNRSVSRDEA